MGFQKKWFFLPLDVVYDTRNCNSHLTARLKMRHIYERITRHGDRSFTICRSWNLHEVIITNCLRPFGLGFSIMALVTNNPGLCSNNKGERVLLLIPCKYLQQPAPCSRLVALNLWHALESPGRLRGRGEWHLLQEFLIQRVWVTAEDLHFPKWGCCCWSRDDVLRPSALNIDTIVPVFSNMLLKNSNFFTDFLLHVSDYKSLSSFWMTTYYYVNVSEFAKPRLLTIIDTSVILGVCVVTLIWTILP